MTSTDIATRPEDVAAAVGAPVGALALRADQTAWTEVQEAALQQIGLAEASDADRMVFLHQCQRTGLDPFARQIYMIGRWDSTLGRNVFTIQVGIDGFRAKAEEKPEYAGQLPLQWCGDDGEWVDVWLRKAKPAAARARVLRRDRDQPHVAVCIFEEFAQYKKGGGLNSMWDTKSAHMIGKCAEAGALRAAFPQTFSGIVTEDEAHGLDRQARTTRVASERAPAAAVDVSELTGRPAAAPTEPARRAPSTAPRTPPPLEGGSKRATSKHTTRLMAALRKADGLEDSKAWATAVLGLPQALTSWGPLTCDQANTLIEKLEAGDIGVIDATPAAPTTPAPADAQDVEDAYRDIEADRDAAQGTLDDASADQ